MLCQWCNDRFNIYRFIVNTRGAIKHNVDTQADTDSDIGTQGAFTR
jgi:hypothetical protein